MSSPIVIHMQRPYASEEEYLLHERFSIEAKSMLLIDQPALPLDTAIVFDVALENGQKPIRAEARVIGYVEPAADRPGGLRVRFRRFGAATKAFIDRAVNGAPAAAAPVLDVPTATTPVLDAPTVSAPVLDVPTATTPVLDAPTVSAPVLNAHTLDVAAEIKPNAASTHTHAPVSLNETDEASGIHRKVVLPVTAPANREALLARLRGRRLG